MRQTSCQAGEKPCRNRGGERGVKRAELRCRQGHKTAPVPHTIIGSECGFCHDGRASTRNQKISAERPLVGKVGSRVESSHPEWALSRLMAKLQNPKPQRASNAPTSRQRRPGISQGFHTPGPHSSSRTPRRVAPSHHERCQCREVAPENINWDWGLDGLTPGPPNSSGHVQH